MELRHLRYFAAVAQELSFRRAAERLHVAQPALSKQIRDLEHEVGVELLERDTTGARLTDAGTVFLAEVERVLEQVRQAVEFAREAKQGKRGQLTIGNVGTMSASFMPASLAAFREKYPDVDVALREMRSLDQINALTSGTIQIGFAGSIGTAIPEEDVEMLPVLQSPMRVILARAHPLAANPTLSFTQLLDERLLGVADPKRVGPDHGELIRGLFTKRGMRPGIVKRVDSLESLLALVAGQQGVSIMPHIISTHHADGIVSRSIREGGPELMFHLWAVWRRGETSQIAHNFIDVLRKVQGRTRRERKAAAAR
ncbi:LysR family transcriptional regulator [Opitutaceae bacterium TAV5]|nr:LysR family transcriptional regulator [Opitutaceae bacterium TAV5]